MMIFKYPIIDRTQTDVEFAKLLKSKGWQNLTDEEKEQWRNGLKGALNLKDVQRVLNNLEYINTDKNYQLIIPTQDDYIVYDNLFESIYWLLFFIYNDAPILPYTTYERWNEIESLLQTTLNEIKTKGTKEVESYRLGFRVGSEKGVVKV